MFSTIENTDNMPKIKDIFRLFNLKWSQNSLFVWNSRTLQQPYHFQSIQFSLHLLFKRPKSNTIGIQEIHFWFLKENVHETFLMCSQQRKEIIYSKENHSRWRKELLKNRNNHTTSSILNTSGIWQQRQRSWCIEYIGILSPGPFFKVLWPIQFYILVFM